MNCVYCKLDDPFEFVFFWEEDFFITLFKASKIICKQREGKSYPCDNHRETAGVHQSAEPGSHLNFYSSMGHNFKALQSNRKFLKNSQLFYLGLNFFIM